MSVLALVENVMSGAWAAVVSAPLGILSSTANTVSRGGVDVRPAVLPSADDRNWIWVEAESSSALVVDMVPALVLSVFRSTQSTPELNDTCQTPWIAVLL